MGSFHLFVFLIRSTSFSDVVFEPAQTFNANKFKILLESCSRKMFWLAANVYVYDGLGFLSASLSHIAE